MFFSVLPYFIWFLMDMAYIIITKIMKNHFLFDAAHIN